MKKENILGILFAITIFLIFLIFLFYYLFPSVKYGGRFGCKVGYMMASPFSLFTSSAAVVKNVVTWLPTIILVSKAIVDISRAASAAYEVYYKIKENQVGEHDWKQVNEYFFLAIHKDVKFKDLFFAHLGYAYFSVKAYEFKLYQPIGFKLGAFVEMMNELAAEIQEKILDNTCQTVWEGVIFDTSKISTECIENLKRETYSYKNILDNIKRNNIYSNLTCLSYILANYIRLTYSETLNLKTKIGKGRSHYQAIFNYTLNEPLYLEDVLSILKIIEYKDKEEIKSLYNIIFENKTAYCRDIDKGKLYNYLKNYYNFPKVCYDDIDSYRRIIVSNIDLEKLERGEYKENPEEEEYHDIIFNEPGTYLVTIGHDGQGSIIITSIKYNFEGQ